MPGGIASGRQGRGLEQLANTWSLPVSQGVWAVAPCTSSVVQVIESPATAVRSSTSRIQRQLAPPWRGFNRT